MTSRYSPIKRLILLVLAVSGLFLLAGCSTKEKNGLKEVLLEKFKDDQDLKDYHLDPENVADCVVKEITDSLPGFAGDPRRDKFFDAYARFLSVKSNADAEKAIKDFEQLFGSAAAARGAATSMPDHIMTCMGKAIDGTDGSRVTK